MNITAMSSKDVNPFSGLRGLPHLLFASGETVPNIIGMKELDAEGYALLHTKEVKPEKLRAICRAFGFKEFHPDILIDAVDTQSTEQAVRTACPGLAKASASGWVWNFTPGTKQMMIGVMRGLAPGDDHTTPVKGSIYVDTRKGGTISLLDPGYTAPLDTRLNIEELLIAQGIHKVRPKQHKEERSFIYKLPSDTTLLKPPWPELAARISQNLDVFFREMPAIRKMNADRQLRCRKFIELLKKLGRAGNLPECFPRKEEEEKNLIAFMNGKWLEIFIFALLDEMKKEGTIDDVRWAMEIWKWDEVSNDYSMSTDLDVAFIVHNNFCHISCKTELNKGIIDELFRISNWKRLFGGGFGKGIVISLSSKGIHHESFARELQVGIIRGRESLEPEKLKQRILEYCS